MPVWTTTNKKNALKWIVERVRGMPILWGGCVRSPFFETAPYLC